ncbi:hypothetical protein [Micromonospora carbonacea]|uniref:Uncharacterized protein n=1 Tax=Micromonospora carbonacea TaxID=47853 RepID=A0A1C5A9V7_9ACTN|nr:hypothetical protein [Micromonospora carbonacea]SCF42007.1 hypothetical protein GA0070563_11226 [Micromonospora carbonacea]
MTCIRFKTSTGLRGLACADISPLPTPNPECPNAGQHMPHPTGYIDHSDWADQMMETHDQQQCPGCGGWHIWVPRSAERG